MGDMATNFHDAGQNLSLGCFADFWIGKLGGSEGLWRDDCDYYDDDIDVRHTSGASGCL